jgi:hypothetical protein
LAAGGLPWLASALTCARNCAPYVEQLAAEAGRRSPSSTASSPPAGNRWRRFHVAELSAAEQAARVCAYLMPERMLALLEAELEKAVELELDVTSIALPAERRWRE